MWFRAGGIRPGQDPYYVHHCPHQLRRHGPDDLTEGDGTHEVAYSPDEEFLIDTYSRVDLPPVTELRRASDGKLVCELETADAGALKAAGWQTPERFVAKGRDGKTDIYGVIFRPTNFDPTKTVSGDRGHLRRAAGGRSCRRRFQPAYAQQAMAELGFIVVQIDGMGTKRSKAFHDVCWKNLGDAGFPDRILWIKAAAAKYPCMDLTRVGIYGGSAGGQNATRAHACSRRLLQGRRGRLRLPRQPHGQDLVERAVDGLAGRAAIRASSQRDQRAQAEGQAAARSSAKWTATSIRPRRCRWSTP